MNSAHDLTQVRRTSNKPTLSFSRSKKSNPADAKWSHQIALESLKGKAVHICADGLCVDESQGEQFVVRNCDQFTVCLDKVRVQKFDTGEKREPVLKNIIVFKSAIQNIAPLMGQ